MQLLRQYINTSIYQYLIKSLCLNANEKCKFIRQKSEFFTLSLPVKRCFTSQKSGTGIGENVKAD